MRHPIDFLDMMVRDVLDFDCVRLAQLAEKRVCIKVLPAGPAVAHEDTMTRIGTMFRAKYSGIKVTCRHNSIEFDTGILKLDILLCYTTGDIRGSTCAGVMADSVRLLPLADQRSLYNSMMTMRDMGFPAHTITMPLGF